MGGLKYLKVPVLENEINTYCLYLDVSFKLPVSTCNVNREVYKIYNSNFYRPFEHICLNLSSPIIIVFLLLFSTKVVFFPFYISFLATYLINTIIFLLKHSLVSLCSQSCPGTCSVDCP